MGHDEDVKLVPGPHGEPSTPVQDRPPTLWHVNSTLRGGGIAEILDALSAQSGPQLMHRRFVIEGPRGIFDMTKRLHYRLHGEDLGPMPSERERKAFVRFGRDNASRLLSVVGQGDLVILHDPHTLSMIPPLVERDLKLGWRCHIGTSFPNATSNATWDYLSEFWDGLSALVFSAESLVPHHAAGHRVQIIAPSIDPSSEKNRWMSDSEIDKVLTDAGIVLGRNHQMIAQVSRWDPLKDMAGVLTAYASSEQLQRAKLVLLGPAPESIVDDPEAERVLKQIHRQWALLPETVRNRVFIVCSKLEDEQTNACLVNAVQRRADVIVQKSLREGFGLTVTEAMIKGRPVVASRVGGIAAQVENGKTGLLINDPYNLDEFARVVSCVLEDRALASQLGAAAARHALDHLSVDREMSDHLDLVELMRLDSD